jgi:hypothetical protein
VHPLKQLRSLLQSSSSNTGKIIQTGEAALQVFTRDGLLSIAQSSQDATRYRVGDTVVLKNGVIVGRRNAISEVYVL